MPFSIPAILACSCFYSGLYLIYAYFAKNDQPFLLILAVVLLVLPVILTPSAHQKERGRFNKTLWYENWLMYPLITWWRLFSLPARLLLSIFLD